MPASARVLADSLAPCGKRLITIEGTYYRGIHSEVLTHKLLSRNSASSRAIPVEKLIERVMGDPFVPSYIGSNQRGMQAGQELSEAARKNAVEGWSWARDQAVEAARKLVTLNVHKQVVNRLIEPFMYITVILSATEWDNFFGLRRHKDAEPHLQEFANLAHEAIEASTPRKLRQGEWHLPLIHEEDVEAVTRMVRLASERVPVEGNEKDQVQRTLVKVSVGRCARVSYLTHDGRRDIREDIALYERLMVQEPLHASPAEHVAQAMDYPSWYIIDLEDPYPDLSDIQRKVAAAREEQRLTPSTHEMKDETVMAQMRSGNFFGWRQHRKTLPNEHIGGPMP